MKIEVEDYGEIRRLFEEEGMSQRRIAATLGISRTTVKKYCEGEQVPWERKPGSGMTETIMTEDVKEFIRACLNEDEKQGLKKQKHTARRIYQRLKEELNFKGGESTVRRYVKELRNHAPHTFIPLEYAPGEAIQVDWGECTVYIDGEKVKINIWCMRECYSADIFCRAFYRQNEESFLEGIRDGLIHYGGVPKKIIFDNAKVAVSEGFGIHAKATEGYRALAAHYVFTPVFCNIASGHEKGLVEGLVGYIRRNFFVPVPHVRTIEELNDMLTEAAKKYRDHMIDGQAETVGTKYETARKAFRPLPPFKFDTAVKAEVRADSFSMVKYDGNRYSVPYHLSGKEVTVKATGNYVSVLYRGEVVTQYTRDYGTGRKHYKLEHYMGLIERRPRSSIDAAPVKQTVPEALLRFLETLEDPHDVVKTLQLYLNQQDKVLKVISNVSSYEALEACVNPCTVRENTESIPNTSHIAVAVYVPELSQYDCLTSGGEVG